DDLAQMPRVEREDALRALLESGNAGSTLRYSDHVVGSGKAFLRHACRMSLEGVVSKRADAPYQPGRSRSWLKAKCIQEQEFVVGGFTDPEGSRTGIGALLLGVHDDSGRLVYVGKVGTGFSNRVAIDLRHKLDRLLPSPSPFTTPPPGPPRGPPVLPARAGGGAGGRGRVHGVDAGRTPAPPVVEGTARGQAGTRDRPRTAGARGRRVSTPGERVERGRARQAGIRAGPDPPDASAGDGDGGR